MSATNISPETTGARMEEEEARHFSRKLAGVFLLFTALLAPAGYVYLSHRQAEARAEAQRELSAIADLKLKQLSSWREERLSDARFFSHAHFVAQDVRRFLDEPDSEAARSVVLHWLDLLKGGERYHAVMVFDTRLERRLALPAAAGQPGPSDRQLLDQAVNGQKVVFSDLHREETNGPVYLDIAFPIFEGAEAKRDAPLAVVLLQLDAQQFLFPLIQSWPVPSQTAETLLVRREGNEVLYLNDLRHRAGTALALRVALATPDLPAAKVLRGDTNIAEGKDYRGVPVVATGRLIPGTSWAMVAKMDREEIYAPLRQQALAVLAVLSALLLAGGLLVALLWRQRNAQFLERELAERKAHERAMERMNRLYAALSQVNQAVVRAGSRDELLRQICRALVQFGGCQMAWVGWADQSDSRVVPLAQFGDEDGYLQRVELVADERSEGRCLVGTAIREGRPCVSNDLFGDPKLPLWHQAGAQSSWRSLAAFPIRQGGRICGVLAVHASQKDFFGTQEQALLEEAASDISFGLDTLLNDQRRKQAEEAVQESEERYRSLFKHMLDGFAYCRVLYENGSPQDFIYLSVNDSFERLTGLKNVVGKKVSEVIPGIHQANPELLRTYGRVALTGQPERFETWVESLGIWFSISVYSPQQEHFVAVFDNITDRKRAEGALGEARDRLARANADLELKVAERTAQLVEANSNLQTFAYTAAHDLRAPLRIIKSFSGLVLEDCRASLGAEARAMLERVTASAEQMGRLLDDLLEYSKMSQAELKLEPVNLRTAVGEALALLDGDIRAKNAIVTVTEPLPEVIGHPATVALLINNLVSNALKFMPPGVQPQIRIWAERRDAETRRRGDAETESSIQHPASSIRLWVEDNGIGIAPEHLGKLFGAFQRLRGKQAYPGTGLGLAIVRKGAERMGGRVGVESGVGKGSRFWIELRLVDR